MNMSCSLHVEEADGRPDVYTLVSDVRDAHHYGITSLCVVGLDRLGAGVLGVLAIDTVFNIQNGMI